MNEAQRCDSLYNNIARAPESVMRGMTFNFLDERLCGDIILSQKIIGGWTEKELNFIPRVNSEGANDGYKPFCVATIRTVSLLSKEYDHKGNNTEEKLYPNTLSLHVEASQGGIFDVEILMEPTGCKWANLTVKEGYIYSRRLALIENLGWQIMFEKGETLLTEESAMNAFNFILEASEALIQQSGFFIPESA